MCVALQKMLLSISFIRRLFGSVSFKKEQRQKDKQRKRTLEQYHAELNEIDKLSKVLMEAIHSSTILQIIQHKEIELCYHQASLKLLIKYPMADIDLIAQKGHEIHVLNKEIQQLKDDYENDLQEFEHLLAHFDERVKELQKQLDASKT